MYQKRLPGIYTAIGLYNIWVEEDFVKGVPTWTQAFEISAKVGDYLALWFGNYQLGWAMCHDYQLKESLVYFADVAGFECYGK